MNVLWDGVELDKSKEAVQNLQRMIWGLESFRQFDVTLASTLDTVRKARADFDHVMRDVRRLCFSMKPCTLDEWLTPFPPQGRRALGPTTPQTPGEGPGTIRQACGRADPSEDQDRAEGHAAVKALRQHWRHDQRGAESRRIGTERQHPDSHIHHHRLPSLGICRGKNQLRITCIQVSLDRMPNELRVGSLRAQQRHPAKKRRARTVYRTHIRVHGRNLCVRDIHPADLGRCWYC